MIPLIVWQESRVYVTGLTEKTDKNAFSSTINRNLTKIDS